MLHLASSMGWTELSCREAQAFSAGGELGAVGGSLSVLVHSVSEACCWATGGTGGPPPWSWGLPSSCPALSRGCCWPCTSCLFFFGEGAFKELWLLLSELADSWEPVVCLVWAPWTSSSEKRTFFSKLRGDEASACAWAEASSFKEAAGTGAVDSLTSSDVLNESGLGDSFSLESWSFWSSTSMSVRASSSSRNSSSVVSQLCEMRLEQQMGCFCLL